MRASVGNLLKTAGCAIFLAAALASPLKAANWQLVWSDEFNGSISGDWSLTNSGGGFGNNEQQYYLPQNATIENGMLAITAKRESVGGNNYTSAKLSTQGHKSWCHGKIVARMALPAFQGSWPAFWMLGDNIGSVGWPSCGELDIMEQINTAGTVYGSTHWYTGGQADFTQSGNTSVTGFHEYSIEWDSQYIKWFIDGAQYSSFYIGGNAGGTGASNQNNFFVILNLAVGGNWPGFTIDNNAFPAKMLVDYVRVYQDSPNVAPAGYTWCANENGSYALNGTCDVAYGANGQFKYLASKTGTITFNNATFGDPIPGVAKSGYYKTSANVGPAGYTWCANENGSYNLSGTCDVAYGANGQFNYLSGRTGTIAFNNATFGDPIPGVAKAGYFKTVSSGAATSLVSGAVYEFVAVCSGKALDLDGWSTADGAKIQQWSRNGAACQQWRVIDMGNGLKLQSASSGKVLDVPAADAHAGQKVQQWSDNGSNAQRFGAAYLGNGVWKFWPVLNGGLCLDVSGASTADGAQVQLWDDNGNNAQRWTLYQR